jgi:UDP-N-acetylglucosamine 2-epimerase (non-hydrolysing)
MTPRTNVIPMRPKTVRRPARTTVLHAAGDDGALVEIASVVTALGRLSSFRQVVVLPRTADAGAAEDIVPLARQRHVDIRAGSDAARTAAALVAFEDILLEECPDVVVVAGDDDTALAAALAAAKLTVAVAHLGSGQRSWDWTLADEINRVIIDRLADTLFTPCAETSANLLAEGVPEGRIHAVGSARIDALRRHEARARERAAWRDHGLPAQGYLLVSLQRLRSLEPAERLERIAASLTVAAADAPVLMVVNAYTRARLTSAHARNLLTARGITFAEPAGYLELLSLQAGAGGIVTDSPAAQVDASALGVPCYTLQSTTACTVTLTHGTNVLVGDDVSELATVRPARRAPTPAAIPLWDGRTGERIAEVLAANYALAAACAEGG